MLIIAELLRIIEVPKNTLIISIWLTPPRKTKASLIYGMPALVT